MPDPFEGAMSLEDETSPPEPAKEPDDNAEPEGAVDVQGRRMVDVSVVAAERKKARENTEKSLREKELAPLQEKVKEVDALKAALNELRPYADLARQHPELWKQPEPTPDAEKVSDEEAATHARRYQLYLADGQPDLKTAKTILADHRNEIRTVAAQAARDAVGPIQAATAEERSRNNFAAMLHLKNSDGQPLVDPETLAKEWVQLPPDLTQHPQVAETVLNAALGKMYRSGKRVSTPAREPLLSEAPSGRSATGTVTLSKLDKRLGLTDKDIAGFRPDSILTIGE